MKNTFTIGCAHGADINLQKQKDEKLMIQVVDRSKEAFDIIFLDREQQLRLLRYLLNQLS